MPVRTTCQVIIRSGDAERVAHKIVINEYTPDTIDQIIKEALHAACSALELKEIKMLRTFEPEISIDIFAEEAGFRPAFHLAAQTLAIISEAGASVDFDPYIYEPDEV